DPWWISGIYDGPMATRSRSSSRTQPAWTSRRIHTLRYILFPTSYCSRPNPSSSLIFMLVNSPGAHRSRYFSSPALRAHIYLPRYMRRSLHSYDGLGRHVEPHYSLLGRATDSPTRGRGCTHFLVRDDSSERTVSSPGGTGYIAFLSLPNDRILAQHSE